MRLRFHVSYDILVYGQIPSADLEGLTARWTAAASVAGIQVRFAPDFDPARHGGYLRAALAMPADNGLGLLLPQSDFSVGFDLYFEWFESRDETADHGLDQVPEPAATIIRKASFCCVVTLSTEDSAASAVCALLSAAGLARVSHGVVVDPEEDTYRDADGTLSSAAVFFTRTFPLTRCMGTSRPFSGW